MVFVVMRGRFAARKVKVLATPSAPGTVTVIVSFAPVLNGLPRQAFNWTVPCLFTLSVWVLRGQPLPLQLTLTVAPSGTFLTASSAKRVCVRLALTKYGIE